MKALSKVIGRFREGGSVLIMVVVLTSLLAIVGTLFLLTSRVSRMETSSIAANKDLILAADSVVAQVCRQLALDVPRSDANGQALQEYYDYPDDYNPWLANLEPEVDINGTPTDATDDVYFWRHISDIYLTIGTQNTWGGMEVSIEDEYQSLALINDSNMSTKLYRADADGDGVSDSVWVQMPDVRGHKGEPIYTAVRVVDNSGMLNVNTAYLFDANEMLDRSKIDGSSQWQINLAALSRRRVSNGTVENSINKLHRWRCGDDANNLPPITLYGKNVIWQYGNPTAPYTPFDISDELELRNRYLLNRTDVDVRIEEVWDNAFQNPYIGTPVTSRLALPDWFYRSRFNASDPNLFLYSYRHIGTAYNMDRIIDADGQRMVNVNSGGVPDAQWLFDEKLSKCIDVDNLLPGDIERMAREFAQAAANIRDYGDNDSNVSTVVVTIDGIDEYYYGFERPCIYISELVVKTKREEAGDPNDPNDDHIHRSYAIEIYKRFGKEEFNDWRLVIDPAPSKGLAEYVIDSSQFADRGGRYRILLFENTETRLASTIEYSDSPANGATGVDPNVQLGWDSGWVWSAKDVNWVVPASFDMYFGTEPNNVRDANNIAGLWDEFIGNQGGASFNPNGSDELELNTTYYWRVDDLDADGDFLAKGDVWEFTTWLVEPNSVVATIDYNDTVFNIGSKITLQRYVQGKGGVGGFIVVDSIGEEIPIPPWLMEIPSNAGEEETLSFHRDLSWHGRIKRLWDANGLDRLNPTLGHSNHYGYPLAQNLYIQPFHHQFNNVGEIGKIFKKSTYYEVPLPVIENRIQIFHTEPDLRLNLENPSVQKMFKYLTVVDPLDHGYNDANEVRIKGRININTAPWFVIAQLPWVSQKTGKNTNYDLAQAIIAYRDKLMGVGGGRPDYSHNGALNSRYLETGITGLREDLGFASIGELNNVIAGDNEKFSVRYYIDGANQRGFPDLSTNRRTKVDGVADDFEERDLIFARISDLVSVRSDIFTAYILVRLGRDGPQKRVMAILDRSGVYSDGLGGTVGDVKIIALHPVPDPR